MADTILPPQPLPGGWGLARMEREACAALLLQLEEEQLSPELRLRARARERARRQLSVTRVRLTRAMMATRTAATTMAIRYSAFTRSSTTSCKNKHVR